MGATSSSPIQTAPGAHPALYTMGTECLGGGQPEHGIDHPPPSGVEAKETVEI